MTSRPRPRSPAQGPDRDGTETTEIGLKTKTDLGTNITVINSRDIFQTSWQYEKLCETSFNNSHCSVQILPTSYFILICVQITLLFSLIFS